MAALQLRDLAGRGVRRMPVEDVMSRNVRFVGGDRSVREAAGMMGELDVGGLPVGGPDAPEGVVTDRDILRRLVACGLDPQRTPVRDIASRPVISCRPDDTVQMAMDLMAANGIRRMPVRGDAGRVVGWVTLADLARTLLVEQPALQAALNELTKTPPG